MLDSELEERYAEFGVSRTRSLARRFCFGPYEADARSGELWKHGLRIPIHRQSFEVLLALLEHPRELVSREDLERCLWPDGISVDFENSLNSAVNRLRDALQDGARCPRYVETLPRRGYRFIAPVEQVSSVPLRLAVLPFANLSLEPANEIFAEAVTDALITELGNVSALRVISRQSILHLKGSRKTLPEIARELRVDVLVGGSAVIDSNGIRISAQLVQAAPEQHLWARAYDCQMGDILTTEGRVARDIAEAVQVVLTGGEIERLSRRRPVDPEAHIAYLKARHHLDQHCREGFHKALQQFQQALEKDPSHAHAYAYMALCYSLLGFWGHQAGAVAYLRAKKAAQEAIQLDETLSVAHWVLGWVSWLRDWDLATSEAEVLRAIELNPSDEGAHVNYAVFLAIVREDGAGAIAEAKLALDLDPLSLGVNTDVAWIHLFVRDFEGALRQARATLELFPEALHAWYVFGWSQLMFARFDAAIEAFERAVAISRDALSIAYLGHAQAMAGHRDIAKSLLDELLSKAELGYVTAKSLICLYAGLGDEDRVLFWLEKAYRDRDPLLFWLRAVPVFGPLAPQIRIWTQERLPKL